MSEKRSPKFGRIHPDALPVVGSVVTDDGELGMEADANVIPQETASAQFARGRCIHVLDGTKHVVGFDPETRRRICRAGWREAVHPEVVTLPKSEIERVIASGFLIDPNAPVTPEPPPGNGAAVH